MKKMGKSNRSYHMNIFQRKNAFFLLCRSLKDIDEFICRVGNEIYELTRRKRKMDGEKFENR
jgi:hypothetical protein